MLLPWIVSSLLEIIITIIELSSHLIPAIVIVGLFGKCYFTYIAVCDNIPLSAPVVHCFLFCDDCVYGLYFCALLELFDIVEHFRTGMPSKIFEDKKTRYSVYSEPMSHMWAVNASSVIESNRFHYCGALSVHSHDSSCTLIHVSCSAVIAYSLHSEIC